MSGVIPSAFVLGAAGVAALLLAVRRTPIADRGRRHRASAVLAVAIVAQCLHFAEEAVTGFPDRLGDLLGLPAMPGSFFLAFNLMWIGLWIASIPAIRAGWTPGFFAAWFLAIAGTLNGIAHPLMALAGRGYFPGLLTSPLVAGVSIWLWVTLRRTTMP
ncbi:MAG: HXXEE domain-containing protein [Gemmatimonadota bacterium]